jgi:hypothetical protein
MTFSTRVRVGPISQSNVVPSLLPVAIVYPVGSEAHRVDQVMRADQWTFWLSG